MSNKTLTKYLLAKYLTGERIGRYLDTSYLSRSVCAKACLIIKPRLHGISGQLHAGGEGGVR